MKLLKLLFPALLATSALGMDDGFFSNDGGDGNNPRELSFLDDAAASTIADTYDFTGEDPVYKSLPLFADPAAHALFARIEATAQQFAAMKPMAAPTLGRQQSRSPKSTREMGQMTQAGIDLEDAGTAAGNDMMFNPEGHHDIYAVLAEPVDKAAVVAKVLDILKTLSTSQKEPKHSIVKDERASWLQQHYLEVPALLYKIDQEDVERFGSLRVFVRDSDKFYGSDKRTIIEFLRGADTDSVFYNRLVREVLHRLAREGVVAAQQPRGAARCSLPTVAVPDREVAFSDDQEARESALRSVLARVTAPISPLNGPADRHLSAQLLARLAEATGKRAMVAKELAQYKARAKRRRVF